MHFWQVLLLLTVSCSTTQFYRDLLSLKPYCKMKEPEYKTSYKVQKMISLFCKNHSDTSGHVILRTTVLKSVMEERGGVLQRNLEYRRLITDKSEGLLSGIMKEVYGGPELPIELFSLFSENVRMVMDQFVKSSLDTVLTEWPFKNLLKKEDWLVYSILDAAAAWKLFRNYYEFIPCDARLFDLETSVSALDESMLDLDGKLSELNASMYDLKDKTFDLSNLESGMETRLTVYLNRYEKFLKPRVQRFEFGCSFAIMVAAYNFIQYLHQISRVYARNISKELVERLQHEHQEFILISVELAKNVTTSERTFIRSLPFDGWWYYDSDINVGLLVPKKLQLQSLGLCSQYANRKSVVKVSMYSVSFQPRKDADSLNMVCVHAIGEQSVELIWYTSHKEHEVGLEIFVKSIGERLSTHKEFLDMIDYSLWDATVGS